MLPDRPLDVLAFRWVGTERGNGVVPLGELGFDCRPVAVERRLGGRGQASAGGAASTITTCCQASSVGVPAVGGDEPDVDGPGGRRRR